MIDVLAALELVAAAASDENGGQLFADARLLYPAYTGLKAKTTTIESLAASGQLKPLVQAAARMTAVASKLVADPAQLKNIAALLSSI
jgi:hypothetical protein